MATSNDVASEIKRLVKLLRSKRAAFRTDSENGVIFAEIAALKIAIRNRRACIPSFPAPENYALTLQGVSNWSFSLRKGGPKFGIKGIAKMRKHWQMRFEALLAGEEVREARRWREECLRINPVTELNALIRPTQQQLHRLRQLPDQSHETAEDIATLEALITKLAEAKRQSRMLKAQVSE